MVMTADDPVSRPDPFTGQLLPIADRQLLRPASVQPGERDHESVVHVTPGDVQLLPMNSVGAPNNPPQSSDFPSGYFYVIGNTVTKSESNPPNATAYLTTAYDPFTGTMAGSTAVPTQRRPSGLLSESGTCCSVDAPDRPRQAEHDAAEDNFRRSRSKQMKYYWICLRRPANPFAPPQPDISLVDANGHSPTTPWSWSMRCGSRSSRGVALRALL